MMIKYLITGLLIYILYTMVMNKPLIPGGRVDKKIDPNQQDNDEGEYVDYEEVE